MIREVHPGRIEAYPGPILDNLTTAVVVLDSALALQYLNTAAEVLFASSSRHCIGTAFLDLAACDSEILAGFRSCLESGHSYTEREVPLVFPAGRRSIVDLSVTAIAQRARPHELLVELRPVDHHLHISREENLISQYNTSRALARGLAHEVKNPLGGIRGAAQLLDQVLEDPELREYTAIVMREADRLRKLVDNMLGPTKSPHRRALSIHEVLEDVHALVVAEVGPALHIARDYDPSIPAIVADRDQLAQAILNLVRNAMQALQGSGHITLRTRVQRQCSIGHKRHRLVARLDIVDDGPGVSAELLETIFLPMITTRSDGSGLGLPIAQNLINQHQGLIECSSRPGETVFTILLPVESSHG
jgi:two-component system nitrogen regulation sensor histidine kinase GlnL